ncbi:hypothetical protein [Prescottella subtropica]|uniref:hypothetical protein n=1 Tax=Prescottella subtropica TaxID=2545757 RepID=UPI0010F9B40D|nr:hypothetical protein [Prescottella subtropica]
MNADALLSTGSHQLCPGCQAALIPVARQLCSTCRQNPAVSVPTPAVKAAPATRGGPLSESRVRDSHRGGLLHQPDHTMWLVAAGKPVTQGSMRAVAVGVIRHENGAQLHAWRDTITREALRVGGVDWASIDGPVRLSVALTVPAPTRPNASAVETVDGRGTPRVAPMTTPDVDKLLRAVQDALSPRDNRKSGESVKTRDRRFKLLTDDARIVDSAAVKTYPAPAHTHPWALPWPGAVIRISSLDVDTDPFPNSTLRQPAQFPAAAVGLRDAVGARRVPA